MVGRVLSFYARIGIYAKSTNFAVLVPAKYPPASARRAPKRKPRNTHVIAC